MNKLTIALALSLSVLGCSSEKNNTNEPIAEVSAIDAAKQKEIVDYLKSDAEPTIKDAVFKQPSHLGVGVIDDGSNRDGFAEYLCSVLKDDFDAQGVRVTVYDIAKLVQTNKWIKIGESRCS